MRPMTPFERYVREEAHEQGLQQGLERGRAREAANIITRQARKRFDTLTPEDETSIRQLALNSLEALSEALLDFSSIDDLRVWLSDRAPRQE